jgi:oxaloacetate decarboxylase beta subunit
LSVGNIDFVFCTAGGIWTVQVLNKFSKVKINPLIGSAGVSAVPMAARVSQVVGLEEKPGNHLIMHAMGPNLAGVMGTAAAAGMFIAMFK